MLASYYSVTGVSTDDSADVSGNDSTDCSGWFSDIDSSATGPVSEDFIVNSVSFPPILIDIT